MTSPRRLIAGRYRLDQALAAGGMGVVWRGWDERLERAVAVKQLRLPPGLSQSETVAARDRAMREARITARLHHPGVVPIYDVVEHDGQPCLIMQFLPSVSLQTRLQTRQTLPVVDVARIGSELAAALTAAHQVGIVHRDVKPGNVLLAEDGSTKLTDFGISHALGDVNLTSTGMVTGTPAYLAPEVARGQPSTYSSDVYSLGSTLYAATEGHPPVQHDDNAMAVLHRAASGHIIPPRRSGPLTPLLLRLLDPDPAARPTMHDAWSALASLHRDLVMAGPAGTGAQSTTATVRARPPRPAAEAVPAQPVFPTRAFARERPGTRARPVLLLLAGLSLIAALAIGVIYFRPTGGGTSGGVDASTSGRTTTRTTSTSRTATGSATSARGSSGSTSSRSPSSPPTSTSSSTTSTSTTATSPASSSGSTGAATTAQLAQAVTGYYALMPTDLAAGWSRLTPTYQSSHAGGFAAYQKFWASVRSVSTGNVVGEPPDSAVATITYHYKDGRTVVERTRYGFTRTNGQLLISTSATLSSRTT